MTKREDEAASATVHVPSDPKRLRPTAVLHRLPCTDTPDRLVGLFVIDKRAGLRRRNSFAYTGPLNDLYHGMVCLFTPKVGRTIEIRLRQD